MFKNTISCKINYNTKSKAFSLIELSIVLLIMAVLTGTLLISRNIVDRAMASNIATEISTMNSAIAQFVDAHQSLPGDFSQATKYLGNNNKGVAVLDGNGDGSIANTTSSQYELYQTFSQLVAAEILVEGFDMNIMKNSFNFTPISTSTIQLPFLNTNGKTILMPIQQGAYTTRLLLNEEAARLKKVSKSNYITFQSINVVESLMNNKSSNMCIISSFSSGMRTDRQIGIKSAFKQSVLKVLKNKIDVDKPKQGRILLIQNDDYQQCHDGGSDFNTNPAVYNASWESNTGYVKSTKFYPDEACNIAFTCEPDLK